MNLLLSILSLLAMHFSQVHCNTRSVPLINYNKWNLPLARNFTLEDPTTGTDFPKGSYVLGLNPSAFFSVIFLDSELVNIEDEITLDYSFYGNNDYTIKGQWVELNITFET
jgi:hypothetical protein